MMVYKIEIPFKGVLSEIISGEKNKWLDFTEIYLKADSIEDAIQKAKEFLADNYSGITSVKQVDMAILL
jgi:hypothetical protein